MSDANSSNILTVEVWAFGRKQQIKIDTCFIANLNSSTHKEYKDGQQNPKPNNYLFKNLCKARNGSINTIVLHCTAANNSAETSVGGWNSILPERETQKAAHDAWVKNGKNGEEPKIPPLASAAYVLERRPTASTETSPVILHRVVEDNKVSFHTGSYNDHSIGIEMANVGDEWKNRYRVRPHLLSHRLI